YAFDDVYSTIENNGLAIEKPGVLANDTTVLPPQPMGASGVANAAANGQTSPVAGLPLMATLITGVQNGDLTLNADGSFSYRPHMNFVGVDTFTYRASLANSATPPGTDPTTGSNTAATSDFVCPANAMCAQPPDDVATVTIYV